MQKRGMKSVSVKDEEMYYIEGNAVRKLNTAPEREVRPEKKKEHQVNERIQKNAKRSRAFDLSYTLVLIAATSVLFVACFTMLTLKTDVMEQKREIAALEKNLTELSDSNNETSKRLDSSVDLTKIYAVATKQLGMVYPKNGQVVSYEATNPDYVKQFKDIPTE